MPVMPEQTTGQPPSAALPLLRKVLDTADRIEAEQSARVSQGVPLVLRALEIATNSYRRCCLSSGQAKALEQCHAELEDLLQ